MQLVEGVKTQVPRERRDYRRAKCVTHWLPIYEVLPLVAVPPTVQYSLDWWCRYMFLTGTRVSHFDIHLRFPSSGGCVEVYIDAEFILSICVGCWSEVLK